MANPLRSFSITHGPTEKERIFLDDWIKILVAFVKDDKTNTYGTKTLTEMMVATPEASIEIQPDPRWDELVRLGDIFGKPLN